MVHKHISDDLVFLNGHQFFLIITTFFDLATLREEEQEARSCRRTKHGEGRVESQVREKRRGRIAEDSAERTQCVDGKDVYPISLLGNLSCERHIPAKTLWIGWSQWKWSAPSCNHTTCPVCPWFDVEPLDLVLASRAGLGRRKLPTNEDASGDRNSSLEP